MGRYLGTTAFVGEPGGGKSYMMVAEAWKGLQSGRPVFTHVSFQLTVPKKYANLVGTYEDVAELVSVRNGLILTDEALMFFGARDWRDLPPELVQKFTQVRKASKGGVRLLYATVEFAHVDTILRSSTSMIWRCRNVFGRWVKATMHRPQRGNEPAAAVSRRLVRMRPEVWRLYDTFNEVDISSSTTRALKKSAAGSRSNILSIPERSRIL